MTREEKLRFYHSTAWKHKSAYILRRDHYECQECRKRIRKAGEDGILLPARERKIRRATAVHHIIHFEDAPDRALDDDNLEAVCARCHNNIHGRIFHGRTGPRRKYVTEEMW